MRHLRGFLLISGRLSLHAAAREMGLSQPALTQALTGLEKRFGVRLFDRRPGGLERTPAGTALDRRVSRCFAYLRQAVARAAAQEQDTRLERRLNALSLSHLRALTAISEVRSFVGAAAHLGLRAPTIHRAIGELEGVLDTRLVWRRSTGAERTTIGKDVARLFSLALSELQSAHADLEELRGLVEGRVSIGTVHVSAASVIPAVIIRMAARFPKASFAAQESDYESMMDALRCGRLDLICSNIRTPLPPDITGQALFDSDLCIIGRRGHPALCNGAVSLQELTRYPWVGAAAQTGATKRFRAMFEQAGFRHPAIVAESLLFELKRALVLGSDFLAIATRAEIIQHHDFDMMEVVKGLMPSARRSVWLLWRRDWRPTHLQRHFVQTLLDVLREVTPEVAQCWPWEELCAGPGGSPEVLAGPGSGNAFGDVRVDNINSLAVQGACPASGPMRQLRRIEKRRISGSS